MKIISKEEYEFLRRNNNAYLELQDRLKDLITKFESEDSEDSLSYSLAAKRLLIAYYGLGGKDV